jgi:hypothetical protein
MRCSGCGDDIEPNDLMLCRDCNLDAMRMRPRSSYTDPGTLRLVQIKTTKGKKKNGYTKAAGTRVP